MKSGLIFDVYDDRGGEVFRTMYGHTSEFSDNVKTASYLSSEDRCSLPDDVFALVMQDDSNKLRKFACVDPGNTELSVLYFLKTAHNLPEEAQKVAAANLCTACSWYDIQPPEELLKAAGIGGIGAFAANTAAKAKGAVGGWLTGKALTGAMALPTVIGAGREAASRVNTVLRSAPGGIMTPENFKMAEANGGTSMPSSRNVDTTSKDKVPVKVSSALHTNEKAVMGPSLNKIPSAKMLPAVDVSCCELGCKKASLQAPVHHYALGSRYPIDTLDQVKTAANYFMEYADRFSPEDRHAYCVNVVKQASAMGISRELPSRVLKYGSETYAPASEFKYAMKQRQELLYDEPEYSAILDELQTKQASITPELLARTLAEFDKEASIDVFYGDRIQDPYYTTFGQQPNVHMTKVAGVNVSEDSLKTLATNPGTITKLAKLYGPDFVAEFQKDPISIFESMPQDQKMLIMGA